MNVWTKKERIRNRLTGDYEDPDEKLMQEVERLLEIKGDVARPAGRSSAGSPRGASTTPA